MPRQIGPAVVEVLTADITTLRVDAIVNAANPGLLGGGGVDGAIHRAGGPEILAQCRLLGGCDTGDAKPTGGGRLPARHVIHTVGPIWHSDRGSGADQLLAACYHRSLEVADQLGCQSLAFPSISTGAYAFPLERAATIAVATVASYLTTRPTGLRRVLHCCFSARDAQVYGQALERVTIEKETGS